MKCKPLILLSLLAMNLLAAAQTKSPVKFGKVTADDFKQKVYSIDSGAAAVVISDVGETVFTGNNSGSFSLIFTRSRRVHILNKSAYDEANVEIELYRSTNGSAEEKLDDVDAVTYNLEDGKVVATKLETRKNIFTDKQSDNNITKKFTLPNVKEGSIIEYRYIIRSDYIFNLQPWYFQGEYPVLWSEYTVTIPEMFDYVRLTQGYNPLFINTTDYGRETYSLRDSRSTEASEGGRYTTNTVISRWVMKDVPGMKYEAFTSSLNNYVSKISFQLKSVRYDNGRIEDRMGSYPKLASQLLEDEEFGLSIDNNNGWLDETIQPLIQQKNSDIEKAQAVYDYVRDNFTCTENGGLFMKSNLRNIMKNKKGSVAEVNLLLTAMLKHMKLTANPVILSTRRHGKPLEMYPLLEKYNYVVCLLQIGNTDYLMDASDPLMGFNHLPLECYNGHARLINKEATALTISPDAVKEAKVTSIYLSEEKGLWTGTFQQRNGFYSSYAIRSDVKKKGRPEFIAGIRSAYNMEGLKIKEDYIDSLNQKDEDIVMGYTFEFRPETDDIVYLNPMFGEAYKENPFKSAKRLYPVEMPFTMDEVYVLNLVIPAGYEVDEVPQSVKALFNDEDGFFEYIVSKTAESISLRSRVKLNRAVFLPEEYETLRDFFAMVVKKHAEQIVLKKKK